MRWAALGLAAAACASAHAGDADYEVRVASEITIAPGASAALSVTIAPSGNRTVSADGPVRVAASAPDAVGLPRRRYTRKDAADPAADAPRFDIKLKARDPGDHELTLDVRFWLCGPKVCRPIQTTRTVTVHVPAPPPPDAAVDAPAPVPVDAGVTGCNNRGRPCARRP